MSVAYITFFSCHHDAVGGEFAVCHLFPRTEHILSSGQGPAALDTDTEFKLNELKEVINVKLSQ